MAAINANQTEAAAFVAALMGDSVDEYVKQFGEKVCDRHAYGIAQGKYPNLFKYALAHGNVDQLLAGACRAGTRGFVERAIASGARNYNEGLIKACRSGTSGIVYTMLNFGADDYWGALNVACKHGDLDSAECVVEAATEAGKPIPKQAFEEALVRAIASKDIPTVKYICSQLA